MRVLGLLMALAFVGCTSTKVVVVTTTVVTKKNLDEYKDSYLKSEDYIDVKKAIDEALKPNATDKAVD